MSTDLDISQLPRDVVAMKMENESFMAMAVAKPRDPAAIVSQLVSLVNAYPEAAADAVYSKPVGTVKRVQCANESCQHTYEVGKTESQFSCPRCECERVSSSRMVKKFAEGLSIRAAESIRSVYGFNRMRTDTEVMDDGKVKVTGVFVDYATGTITEDSRIVTPFYKGHNGQMNRTPEDRFLNVVVKAEKAKLRRDVILDSVPNIVKAAYRDACERRTADLLTDEYIDAKILPAFAQYGLKLDDLEKIVGRPKSLGWTQADRTELLRIVTALKNEETTVAELLRQDDQPPVSRQAKTVSGADLTSGAASKTERTGKSKQPAPALDQATCDELDAALDSAETVEQVDAIEGRICAGKPSAQQLAIVAACDKRRSEIKRS